MEENNVEIQNRELKGKLVQNLEHLQTALGISVKLERKIMEMESSRFWKVRRLYKSIRPFLKRLLLRGRKRQLWMTDLVVKPSKNLFWLIRKFCSFVFKHLYLLFEDKPVRIIFANPVKQEKRSYSFSIEQEWSYRRREELSFFTQKPLISVILPVYNTPLSFLKEAIESVLMQDYAHWELCIADDCSTDPGIKKLLEEYKQQDKRIKVLYRSQNGHISACSNSAIEIAEGEFLALLDHDDLLTMDALFEVVRKINLYPSADFIYSDEDKLELDGSYSSPYFKPDWCPDSLLSRNYITHFSVIRRSLVNQVGGFRLGYEGSQDYDLFLRVTELTNQIVHIPKILYHWRVHPNSTSFASESKGYAYDAAKRALEDAVSRRKERAKVTMENHGPGYYTLRYSPGRNSKISIIIPTKDQASILEKCIDSVFSVTAYTNFEVIVVSNNSKETALFSLLEKYKSTYGERFSSYEDNIPFNYAALMNHAAAKAKGEVLLFLNNDTEVIHADWLEEMLGQAERETIGCVGSKLLYPDGTVQHAGVVIGLGGIAGHVFVGEDRNEKGYFCQLSTINNYSALTGACLMCRKTVFEEVEGYDERFKMEFNDVDFCLKIKERGYQNVYLSQVELYHHESLTRGNPLSTKAAIEQHMTETELFRSKWQKYIDHDPCFSIYFDKRYSNYKLTV